MRFCPGAESPQTELEQVYCTLQKFILTSQPLAGVLASNRPDWTCERSAARSVCAWPIYLEVTIDER